MFHGVYIIWFLLPLALLLLTGWALIKPFFGVAGREYAGDYFKQALFCLIGFFIALGIDMLSFDDFLLQLSGESKDAVQIVHWILYPVVLLVLAYLHRLYQKARGQDPNRFINEGLARYKR